MSGLMGLGLGALSGGSQKKAARHLRRRMETERDSALGYLNQFRERYEEDPLISALLNMYQGELGGIPSLEQRGALNDAAFRSALGLLGGVDPETGDVIEGEALGLSDPRVQENIISQTIENELVPQFEGLGRREEERFAGRGLGRSGLAESAARERGYEFAKAGADIRRRVTTEGALEALRERLAKMQAVQGVLGQQEGIAGGRLAAGGQFGLANQGLLGDLAQALADIRMRHSGYLAGVGRDPDQQTSALQGWLATL